MMLVQPDLPVTNLRRRPRRGPHLRRPAPSLKGYTPPSASCSAS